MLTILGTIALGVVAFVVLVYIMGILLSLLVGGIGLSFVLIKYGVSLLIVYLILKWFGLVGKGKN